MADDLEEMQFDDAEVFRAWLAENDDTSPGIWLILAKKAAPYLTVTYAEAVDAALEHGWIDGQGRRRDEHSSLQRMTPRRPKSIWSMRNVRIVEQKIEEGRMSARGLAEVEKARADGRWERAYEGSAAMEPQPDFIEALGKSPAASAFFETLNKQNRFAIYFRIQNSKRAETRARWIERIVGMLERGEKFYL